MNKKWFMLLTSSLLAAFLLTGCATDDPDPAPPGTEDDGMGQELEEEGEELENEVDEMTPGDETTPGETEQGEGTPGEMDEGTTEDPEANMDDKNNAGAGDQGTTNQ
ncbi:hypothetical protein JOC85_003305 [Bacillus mesophilus]|uniref:Lipoprotein n=1 Tax=Bacillus mesophilus TaxID=1808955 RepID=A0A6M0Q9F2_9BACI|nr:hypothetical protein [Bacillus mesophilus]MBM7662498.1 hypothetical protein [Bacillus mesophilus]NEY72877.1 hypothetical protein [Bacillus mesophilus]